MSSNDVLAPSTRDLIPYLLHLTVNRIHARWRDDLRPHGLTVARWQTLSVLSIYDGSRVSEIAQLAGADQPVTTRVIDQMERDGLVERRTSADDGRVVEVWLTPHGRSVYDDLVPQARAMVEQLLVDLDDDTVDKLATTLSRVVDRVDATANEAATERDTERDTERAGVR